MYFVEQKYYDNGRVVAAILLESEAHAKGYHDGYQEELDGYDLYVESFRTYEQAEAWMQEALNA